MASVKAIVRPGKKHGALDNYGPGDTLFVSEADLVAFSDKLIRVGDDTPAAPAAPAAPDGEFVFEGATVEAILAAVAEGAITADQAIDYENTRPKPRKSLLDGLGVS